MCGSQRGEDEPEGLKPLEKAAFGRSLAQGQVGDGHPFDDPDLPALGPGGAITPDIMDGIGLGGNLSQVEHDMAFHVKNALSWQGFFKQACPARFFRGVWGKEDPFPAGFGLGRRISGQADADAGKDLLYELGAVLLSLGTAPSIGGVKHLKGLLNDVAGGIIKVAWDPIPGVEVSGVKGEGAVCLPGREKNGKSARRGRGGRG